MAAIQNLESSAPAKMKIAAKGNVLVIEDDPDTAETVALIVRGAGYGVRTAVNREAALLVLQSNLYDIIIMDLMMPGMGPIEFMQKVRTHAPLSKFILMTATSRVASQARNLGMTWWIGKPFDPNQLLDTISKCTS